MIGDERIDLFVAHEDRVGAVALALRRGVGRLVEGIEQGDEARPVDGQHGVHGHQAPGHGILA